MNTYIELLEQNGFSRFVDEPTFGNLIKWLIDNNVRVSLYYEYRYHCELVLNGYAYTGRGKSYKKALLKAMGKVAQGHD